jgi:hypothetical protein
MTMAWQAAKPTKSRTRQNLIGQLGRTHVALSFGARGGGALFAQWLRLKIMKKRGYKGVNNVYLDTIGLQTATGTKITPIPQGRPTAVGFASLNDGWAGYYQYAVEQAHTMIFVATNEWFRSSNCMGELKRFLEVNQATPGDDKIKGIALRFREDSAATVSFPGMEEIWTERKYGVPDPEDRMALKGNLRDFWMVDGLTLSALFAAIAPDEPPSGVGDDA